MTRIITAPASRVTPAEAFTHRTADCETCGGTGEVTAAIRWAGEGIGGELVGDRCDDCGGSGEADAMCIECRRIVPLNADGECEKCVDGCQLSLADFNEKYGLTETVGDPFLQAKRRAA